MLDIKGPIYFKNYMCDKRTYIRDVLGHFYPQSASGKRLRARIKAGRFTRFISGEAFRSRNRPRERPSTNSGFNANKILRANIIISPFAIPTTRCAIALQLQLKSTFLLAEKSTCELRESQFFILRPTELVSSIAF